MRMKFLGALFALLAAALPAQAQLATTPQQVNRVQLVAAYDVPAAVEYCVTAGKNGWVLDKGKPGLARVKTASANIATVTAYGAIAPFQGLLAVGDVVTFAIGGRTYTRTVTVINSASSIDVDPVVDLTGDGGATFTYKTLACDDTATAGWFPTGSYGSLQLSLVVETTGSDIDYTLECTDDSAAAGVTPVVLVSGNVTTTAAPLTEAVVSNLQYERCRVGLVEGAANTDEVYAWVTLSK